MPKVYAVLGAAGIYVFFIFMNWGGQLLANLAGVALPTYYSLIAIESTGTADDTRLLTYWAVYGVISVIEYWSSTILYWIPFYYLLRFVFQFWLVLPQFNGAEILYHKVVRPATIKYTKSNKVPAELKPHGM